jgi:response regulator NasT
VAAKRKILVVDDDRLVLATLVHGLSQAGYEVIDADNGDDAILAARERRPELALLDIRMEGKTGFDVAAYLREHDRVPFMFLSAFNDEATVAQVRALGAVAYLTKPLDIAQLVPAVDEVYGRYCAGGQASAKPEGEADALRDIVAIAVGVLMHRHSILRAQALERLRRRAQAGGLSLEEECRRLVAAVESMACAVDL